MFTQEENIILISTTIEGEPKYNSFYWSGKYLSDILDYLEVDYQSLPNIKYAILYYGKAQQKFYNSLLLKITAVDAKTNFLKIYFEKVKTLQYQSYLIKDALKKYIKVKSIAELPFLFVINTKKFEEILNDLKIISTIRTLEEKNNWQEIFNLLQTYQPIEKSIIWNDAELLNSFSFATAKLSECTENLKRKFPDKNQRNKFIEEKRNLRNLTLTLRNRAIELQPNNASFYSNLAYSYYQSVNELSTVGGRRDGNIFEEAEKSIYYLNKALSINPNRLTDLYRKALLYSNILGTQKFFKEYNEVNIEKIKNDYLNSIKQSINCFTRIEQIYESITNTEEKQKQKKIYIKTLYHLAQKYLKLNKLNYNLFYNQNKLYETDEITSNLKVADNYIDKCIKIDYNRKKEETQIIEMATVNNFICGVFKTYLKGIIQMYLYLTTKNKIYENNSRQFLQQSLETNFPKEMKNQNKIFILEKISTLNIITENYPAAVKILEPIYNKYQNLAPYAAYTLAIAYIKNEQKENAKQLIEKYSTETNDLFKYKFEKLKEQLIYENLNYDISEKIYGDYEENIE
ncbi:MAG: hypothetical protein N2321_00430 [Melioribacteraceae bacterium]|nr:hypothetical protein [Melioribacteraceae bacterium]